MQGLILLDKPQGITSFSAAAAIRRISGVKRVGHTGTLDPMATGVLPILIGQATRLSSLLIEADKRYTATMKLGIVTDTLDITGTVLSRKAPNITFEQFSEVAQSFRGKIEQIPPMYSAIKKDGQRLYELARQGISVERNPRKINIYELNILSNTVDEYILDVLCSKGTYIRTLVSDIGEYLGCGAVLTALRRTNSAGFNIAECVTLEELKANGIEKYILPADNAVADYDKVEITDKQAVRFSNGGELDLDRISLKNYDNARLIKVYYKDTFLGMGEINSERHALTIKCIINNPFGREQH